MSREEYNNSSHPSSNSNSNSEINFINFENNNTQNYLYYHSHHNHQTTTSSRSSANTYTPPPPPQQQPQQQQVVHNSYIDTRSEPLLQHNHPQQQPQNFIIEPSRPPIPELSILNEDDYIQYYEKRDYAATTPSLAYYKNKQLQLTKLSQEALQRWDQTLLSSPVSVQSKVSSSTVEQQLPLSPRLVINKTSQKITTRESLEETASVTVEWTPMDSAYGAACPICGCMPKQIRRAIEVSLFTILFILFISFFVGICVSLTNQHSDGYDPSKKDNSIFTDDDYYVVAKNDDYYHAIQDDYSYNNTSFDD